MGYFHSSGGPVLGQALHWNGNKWSRVATPNPGGGAIHDSTSLNAVTCSSASNCWAVGDFQPTGGADQNLALRWRGHAWSRVGTPQPAGTSGQDVNLLVGISCVSQSYCTAVGADSTTGFHSALNQVLHWNGHKWLHLSAPQPAGTSHGRFNRLWGISCVSSSDCWTVGNLQHTFPHATTRLDEALHWNGSKWSTVSTPEPGGTAGNHYNDLYAVTCSSASRCWAVGDFSGSAEGANQTLHWNGSTWSHVTAPNPGNMSNDLLGVSCSSDTNCWAAGVSRNIRSKSTSEKLHWNGSSWTIG